MTDPKLPVNTQSFWRTRINRTLAQCRSIHTVIFDTDDGNWQLQQDQTRQLLPRYVKSGESFLDAGCGIGMMWECVPAKVQYHGVDISPDLIEIARMRVPNVRFDVEDLRRLPFADKQFDIAVCRAMREMTINNFGLDEWSLLQTEIQRVSKRLLIVEYGSPLQYELLE